MSRKPHWLRPVKRAAYPRELIAFDTETAAVWLDDDTCENVLTFGWACYSRYIKESQWSEPKWFRFTTGQQLWEWIGNVSRPKQQTYVYCHNVNFDWQTTDMCRILPSLGWTCDQAIINDPPNAFRWRRDNKTLRLLDSFNYFYASLAQIGDRIDLPKLTSKHAYHFEILDDDYCRRDSLIVLRAVQQWIEWLRTNDLGSLAISLAAQSMNAYKHHFLHHNIYIDDNDDAQDLARLSYFGGRVEAWRVGVPVSNVYCLDVNSLYPYVMREQSYPVKLHGVYKRVRLAELSRWLDKYSVVATVLLDTREPAYPERGESKLLFPVGQFWTTLTTPELKHALAHNRIRECSTASIYDSAPMFREYMDTFYDLRLEAMHADDATATYFIKKLMNSHYGKWAQRGGHEEIIGYTDDYSLRVEDEIDIDTAKRYRIRYIAGVITSCSLDKESRESLPAISSHVTAYGRMLLWRLACIAGPENVYYMDTDSLHVHERAMHNLSSEIDATRLGALKLEKTIARAIYYGPKDYSLDGVRKTKGIRGNATEVEPGVFEQQQFVSLRGACSANWNGGPIIRRVRKRLSRVYTKGVVDASGNVLPFERSAGKVGPVSD